jgi:hypothetical protein
MPSQPALATRLLSFPVFSAAVRDRTLEPMIELNPIRNRIADLIGRLDSLRGFL